MRIRLAIVAVMILAVVGVLGARAAWQAGRSAPEAFDLLILNGRVFDGSGNPWLREDLGIRGDRIVARGRLQGSSATRVLDAQGLIVAPGFIDVHSHASGSLARETLREAQGLLAQGITTEARAVRQRYEIGASCQSTCSLSQLRSHSAADAFRHAALLDGPIHSGFSLLALGGPGASAP